MVYMEGYLSKKGKRIGSRVKRYMKLEGTTLSNHHSPDVPATWQVSIKDATVTANPRRKKLIIELYQAKMELYCDTRQECEKWVECLGQARKLLREKEEGDKENTGAAANDAADGDKAATDAAQVEDASAKEETSNLRTVNNLSKSFKVVKPEVRQMISDDAESDDGFDPDDADDADEHQPKNGPRIYEETPNSMIFKQFAFNPK